jgi:Cys-rich protein (TIGR01571 family)
VRDISFFFLIQKKTYWLTLLLFFFSLSYYAGCVACWCPCITYGKNVTRYRHLRDTNQPHPSGGDGCGSDCWIHCLLTSCLAAGWVLQIFSRENTRSRYGVRGSVFGDCCAVCWCGPCELTQEHLELEAEEDQLRKTGAPGVIV